MKGATKYSYLVIIFLLEVLDICTSMPTNEISLDDTVLVRQLQQEIEILREEVSDLKATLDNQATKQHSLTKRSLFVFPRSSYMTRSIDVNPAFHARVSDTPFTATKNDIVKFTQVSTNIGRGYNKDTGIFTAPVSGLYFFTLHISSDQQKYAEACILKNDVIHGTAVSDVRSNTGWDQGSTSVVLSLDKGDKVTVKVLFPHGSYSLLGEGKSTFSGFLVASN